MPRVPPKAQPITHDHWDFQIGGGFAFQWWLALMIHEIIKRPSNLKHMGIECPKTALEEINKAAFATAGKGRDVYLEGDDQLFEDINVLQGKPGSALMACFIQVKGSKHEENLGETGVIIKALAKFGENQNLSLLHDYNYVIASNSKLSPPLKKAFSKLTIYNTNAVKLIIRVAEARLNKRRNVKKGRIFTEKRVKGLQEKIIQEAYPKVLSLPIKAAIANCVRKGKAGPIMPLTEISDVLISTIAIFHKIIVVDSISKRSLLFAIKKISHGDDQLAQSLFYKAMETSISFQKHDTFKHKKYSALSLKFSTHKKNFGGGFLDL